MADDTFFGGLLIPAPSTTIDPTWDIDNLSWDLTPATVPMGQGTIGMAFITDYPPNVGLIGIALYSAYPDGSGAQWNLPQPNTGNNYIPRSTIQGIDCSSVSFLSSSIPIIVGAAFVAGANGVVTIKFKLADGQYYQNNSFAVTLPKNGLLKCVRIPVGSPYIARPGIPYFAGAGMVKDDAGNYFSPAFYIDGVMPMPQGQYGDI